VTAIINWAKSAFRISGNPFIVAVLLAGALLLLARARWGRRFVVALALAYWFVSTPLGSGMLVAPLARGFHPIEDPHAAAGAGAIVVLGGGTFEATSGPAMLGLPRRGTAMRIVEAVRVFRLLGGRPIVVASGGRPLPDQRVAEGDVIASELVQLHVPPDHIVTETRSETTHDEAVIVMAMLRARGIQRIVLVTSPTHMWRSVLTFRAQHADVVPSPAPLGAPGIASPRFFLPKQESIEVSDEALYDYFGTLYYWTRGWLTAGAARQ
jgi:uncharacterized SAM-binding protein YcdF (DUF218 family)